MCAHVSSRPLHRRALCPIAAALAACLLLAACGEATLGHAHAFAAGARVAAARAARAAAGAAGPSEHGSARVIAKIDASSDRILAEGRVHVAEGAPSDAQIRRELEAARKAGIPLPAGDSVSAFESAQGQTVATASGASVPQAAWNPRGRPIADWIVPILEWASQHGWGGTVTSGYRTFYEQAQLNAAGAYSAPAGLSNHETTRYPGGAVDVTDPAQLIVVLRGYPGPLKLVGGVLGPVDPEHFSATGD
jgi:hypothetical protein